MKKRNFSAEFNANPLNWLLTRNTRWQMPPKLWMLAFPTMTRWVKQLRDERQGKTPKASPITPEQIEIRKLRKKKSYNALKWRMKY